jgi:hypothetical protein
MPVEFTRSVNIITIKRDGSDEDDVDEGEGDCDGVDVCSIPSHGPLRADYPPAGSQPQ